jgi:hypothetical protein
MSQDEVNRAKLARLADAIIDDVMAMSDDEIIAEVGHSDIERARALFTEAQTLISRQLLVKARSELEAWRNTQANGSSSLDRPPARECFEKLRNADPTFNQKMTMAARNGREPTDRDQEGLIDDWEELKRLDERDTSE